MTNTLEYLVPTEDNDTIIREAVTGARDGDRETFVMCAQHLQDGGWTRSLPTITDALVRALEAFTEVTPNTAAALTARLAERYAGSIDVAATVMEAVLRGVAGDSRTLEDIPPNVTGIYSLLLIGQLVYEDYLNTTEVFARARL